MVLLLDAPVDAIALSRRLTDSAAAIRAVCQTPARVGLILGSGLGAVADALPDVRRLPFAHIPHFAPMGVEGHGGVMAIAAPGGLGVIALQGRYHYYEGHDMAAVTYPVRVLRALGVTTLILTNAAGGMDPAFGPGDLMLMVDHLNLMGVHRCAVPTTRRLARVSPI